MSKRGTPTTSSDSASSKKIKTHSFSFDDFVKSTFPSFDLNGQSKSNLNNIINDEFERKINDDEKPSNISEIFQYKVPELSKDGLSCSISKKLEKEPFDLSKIPYNVSIDSVWESHRGVVEKQMHLRNCVKQIENLLKCEWFGIYKLIQHEGSPTLVKLAYIGEPSRALFPVTEQWLKISNNSTVAHTKRARMIADVNNVDSSSDPYYECSSKVLSEFCVPILSASDGNELIGIIDAESWTANFFDTEKQIQILKICYDLGLFL